MLASEEADNEPPPPKGAVFRFICQLRYSESMSVDSEQELRWIIRLLDMYGVPDESMEAQGEGETQWTIAGRVDHVLRLLKENNVDVSKSSVFQLRQKHVHDMVSA